MRDVLVRGDDATRASVSSVDEASERMEMIEVMRSRSPDVSQMKRWRIRRWCGGILCNLRAKMRILEGSMTHMDW